MMAKQNVKQPLLQFLMSHIPLEILQVCKFGSQETFLNIIIINVENICAILRLS